LIVITAVRAGLKFTFQHQSCADAFRKNISFRRTTYVAER
jgi:hypothetical protein